VNNVCNVIKTGDVVTLNMDGSIEVLAERRGEDSPMRSSEAETAAADAAANTATIHQLKVRHDGVARRIDRRAMKGALSDRRQQPRTEANGEPAMDRRQANRLANALSLRDHYLKKAS